MFFYAFIIELTTSLGDLRVASGSPVLLQATCQKVNLTDASKRVLLPLVSLL